MPTIAYTLTEYDPDRPWIVVAQTRETVDLDDAGDFFAWANEHRPAPQYSVAPDPPSRL